MKRRLLNILAGSSLVLCLATCALWVRSYWWCDDLLHYAPQSRLDFMSTGGAITCLHVTAQSDESSWAYGHSRTFPNKGIDTGTGSDALYFLFGLNGNGARLHWERAGVEITIIPAPSLTFRLVRISDGYTVLILALLPTATVVSGWSRRRNRRFNARCIHCGYDLRATPERCPECGTVPVARKA